MGNRLSGKVVAITGGSQGIGLAIAQRFAEEGADISFCYRSNKAGADEVVANIQKTGRKVAGFQYDVSSVSDGQKFITDTAAQFGKIDVLVNNAGLERRADFWDVTEIAEESHQHQLRSRRASLPAFRFVLRQQGRRKNVDSQSLH